MSICYKEDLEGVDWEALKKELVADDFDNERTPAQLRRSFANSFATCIAYDGPRIVGTARALSDRVCNAYIVDVWTHSAYRRQGVARHMMNSLLDRLTGQHVYLFTDDAMNFYTKLGFAPQGTGMACVVGEWLSGAAADDDAAG